MEVTLHDLCWDTQHQTIIVRLVCLSVFVEVQQNIIIIMIIQHCRRFAVNSQKPFGLVSFRANSLRSIDWFICKSFSCYLTKLWVKR